MTPGTGADPSEWPVTGARSVAALWRNRVRATPQARAFSYPRGTTWVPVTWSEADARVRRIAAGLLAHGAPVGARIAILSRTRIEWIYVDFAILCAGAATSTIYPSVTADEAVYVLHDADCWGVFVEDGTQLAKIRAGGARTAHVFVIAPEEGLEAGGWTSLAELEAEGARLLDGDPGSVDARIDAIGPEDLATLIYTSGTTGRPKGVVLAHDCWLYQAEAVRLAIELRAGDEQYLFLPLAHSFGKICELIAVELGVPTAVDGEIDHVVAGLAAVRPTVMAAVPRVFEKIFNRVVTEARKRGERPYAVFRWALATGDAAVRAREAGHVPWSLRVKLAVADRLVFRRLRDRLGGRIRAFVSGGAPLSPEIGRFFQAAGMLVVEGYGLTETSAGAVANRPDDLRFGTVGRPFPGCELSLAPDSGEILLRGRNVMRGYWNRPEDTARAIDADRWFHTGDVGSFDPEGRLVITGRIKDLIVTSGGKNIAPSDTEHAVKARCSLLAELVMIGDKRPFCIALAWLDPEAAAARGRELGRSDLGYSALAADPAITAEVQAAVDAVNATLPAYATIKHVHVVADAPISQESGLLTPSLKVKRTVVAERYADAIDQHYAGTIAVV